MTVQVWLSGQPDTWIVNFAGSLQALRATAGAAEFEYQANELANQKTGRYEWRVIMRCYYLNNRVRQSLPVAEAVAYGAFQFDPSSDVTATPFQSPTPIPTITAIPSWDPFTSHGPLAILKIELDSSARDASRPNGAIAQLRMSYAGGAAPYRVSIGGEVVATGLVPARGAWIVFPVLTSCGGNIVSSVQLSSADNQTANFDVFIANIPC